MSYVTTQLDDESGIQYQGVQDKTDLNQIGTMANMLMLVEDIPRGRLDGSMTITKANKTAMLGQEKGNLYLQAVEDALDQNVPSIQVLRVNSGGSGIEHNIGCAGAKDSFKMYVAVKDDNMESFSAAANVTAPFTLTAIIDGIEYSEEVPPPSWYLAEGVEEVPPFLPPGYVAHSVVKVKNLDNKNHRIAYKSSNINGQIFIYDNSTAIFNGDHTEAGVCLGPKSKEISPEGAIEWVDVFVFRSISSPALIPPTLKLDDLVISDGVVFPEWIRIDETMSMQPPAGYEQASVARYVNVGTENHRVEIQTVGNTKVLMMNNSESVVEFVKDGHYGVILTPKPETNEPPWDIEYVDNGETYRLLTGRDIPDNVEYGTPYASSLKINNTVETIGIRAFAVWSYATKLELSESIRHLGNAAFREWIRATTLIIPEGLMTIGAECFTQWRMLKTLKLPSTVVSMGNRAFETCQVLESITILAQNPPSIGVLVFSQTNNAPIYVPAASVEAYKAALNWSEYADRIQAIPV
ncbi:leucine-rich repeat domain-containing protein [Acinetobacter colistiniresistens]|uniref:leucine-rich repeat domain-containing protein n=1 Tax=Acinetobacter colistiniresistens TaxID=280145 RepID=UPI00124FA50C|nr:leucine-rich repeat domain-containing protein [Acinetobacter colistiniresistens]